MTGTLKFLPTGNTNIDTLSTGSKWNVDTGGTITWGVGVHDYYWSTWQVDIINRAFAEWEAVIDVKFQYTGSYRDYRDSRPDIMLSLVNKEYLPPLTEAASLIPDSVNADSFALGKGQNNWTWPHPEGDIFFNVQGDKWSWFDVGDKYYTKASADIFFDTVLHEIGHSLGLKHPHEDKFDGFPTFQAVDRSLYDSKLLTLMSYKGSTVAATPLPIDIYAAQGIYGANTKNEAGDNLYYLSEDNLVRTIYDVSGIDTLNALALDNGITLKLNQGSSSMISPTTWVHIPFGIIIENAKGTIYDDVISGGRGANVISGMWGNDIIFGLEGNDTLNGDHGDDTIFADGGSDTITGGVGLDTIKYPLARENYTLANVAESSASILEIIKGTTDNINTVERLSFSDVNVALDIAAKPGEAYRLYKAAFDRAPDLVGLGFWIKALDNGETALKMASEFNSSPEFISLYGANNSNDDYLNLLYNNVLDRDGDPGGHAFWLGHLNAGSVTRERLLIDFSESVENQANVVDLIANGIDYMPYG